MPTHLRPNGPYLIVMAAAIVGIAFGISELLRGGAVNGVFGAVIVAGCAAVLALLGVPLVVSMVFRVPVLVVDADGIRLPLMGVRLSWSEVSGVKVLAGVGGRPRPRVLIVPTDPDHVVRQARPWLRREARTNLARHGTPLVVQDASLNRSVDEIAATIRRYR